MTVKFRKGLGLGPGLGLEDPNERPGGSVDQREMHFGWQVECESIEYGVWSIGRGTISGVE